MSLVNWLPSVSTQSRVFISGNEIQGMVTYIPVGGGAGEMAMGGKNGREAKSICIHATLAQRLKEHKRALVNGHLAQSAVAEHAAQESHDIDWEGATVMDVQQQYHRRCLLESWHIRSELNTMNRDEGNLLPVYDLLIRQSHSPD